MLSEERSRFERENWELSCRHVNFELIRDQSGVDKLAVSHRNKECDPGFYETSVSVTQLYFKFIIFYIIEHEIFVQ